jgi:hypothetical protein
LWALQLSSSTTLLKFIDGFFMINFIDNKLPLSDFFQN